MSMNAKTSSAAPTKRKRSDEVRVSKFYAVRTGLRPGIYGTWKECYEQIDRFKGARYKAFSNYKDAQDFVEGKPVLNKGGSKQVEKFYGVAVGHIPGVYTDWVEASLQIKNIKGPKFKSFLTRAEAELFVMNKGTDLKTLDQTAQDKGEISDEMEEEQKLIVEECEKERGKAGQKRKCVSKLTQADRSEKGHDSHVIKVYTDGSAIKNGKEGASAGIGVFFGTNDPRNISEPLQGRLQTNQRAELTAVLRALQTCPEGEDVQIFTDSTYSINCLTKWYKVWLKNNWRASNGSPVVNKDLVEAIRGLMDHRTSMGSKTDLLWVRGHNHNIGNEAADRLAVASANPNC